MEKNHFVLGFVFNSDCTKVLLVLKKRPLWMKGRINGIGGHIEDDESPIQAMHREYKEETDMAQVWKHAVTFTCDSGTVYVFKAISTCFHIPFTQIEDETLIEEGITHLHLIPVMTNLKYLIPLCLSSCQFPIMLQQNKLGTE